MRILIILVSFFIFNSGLVVYANEQEDDYTLLLEIDSLTISTYNQYTYHLNSPATIYLKEMEGGNAYNRITFYNSDDEIVYRGYTSAFRLMDDEQLKTNPLRNVSYIVFSGHSNSSSHRTTISNFKIYGLYDGYGKLDDVEGVTKREYHNRIYLEWLNPEHENFKKVMVYQEEDLLYEVEAPLNYKLIDSLEPQTHYTFVLKSYYDPPGDYSDGVTVSAITQAVPEVKLIDYELINDRNLLVNFEKPNLLEYEKAELYLNGNKVSETTNDTFNISNLSSGEHEIVIKTVTNDGYLSNGVKFIVEVPEIPDEFEVVDLQAEPKHNRVNLSWNNPSYNDFHHVIIYRKDVSNRSSFNQLLLGSTVYADDGFKQIFETNGTYFNDLTVNPDTAYEYKLTTQSIEGIESEGVTIQVTTPPEPPPEMDGVEQEQDENGDYVFKWTSPTDGQVKVIVGGDEYTTVPASDGQITIPQDDMKYTLLGNPDVRLVPISESGQEGVPTNPNAPGSGGGGIGGVTLPFSPKDVLTSSVQLLSVVGPFLLLALAIYVTNVYLIPLIRKAVKNQQVKEGRGRRRERA